METGYSDKKQSNFQKGFDADENARSKDAYAI